MSLVLLYKPEKILKENESYEMIVGFSEINEQELLKEIVKRLVNLYFKEEDFVIHANPTILQFKGNRIVNDINTYIENEKHKLKDNYFISLELYSWNVEVVGQKKKMSVVCFKALTQNTSLFKTHNKFFKKYLINNVFKHIDYVQI